MAKPPRLTEKELEVMKLLWDRGPLTVNEIRDVLGSATAYTTVLSLLQTLEHKGHVGHSRYGRAYKYGALTREHNVKRRAVSQMIARFFSGSPSLLMSHLVEHKKLSQHELRELRDLVDQHLRKK